MMQWTVTQMDCYPEKDGDVDVVFTVHWTLTDTQDGYTGSMYGTAGVFLDSESPFTPYDQLTEAQVVGWVKDSLGPVQVADMEASVLRQIEDQKNPPIVTPPLPW